jgi:hypothetical protein
MGCDDLQFLFNEGKQANLIRRRTVLIISELRIQRQKLTPTDRRADRKTILSLHHIQCRAIKLPQTQLSFTSDINVERNQVPKSGFALHCSVQ